MHEQAASDKPVAAAISASVNTSSFGAILAVAHSRVRRRSAREGLRAARHVRNEKILAIVLQHLARLAALCSDRCRAAQLLGYVDVQYSVLGSQREPTEQWGYDKLVAALRETLSADEIARLAADGAAWSEDQAAEEALKP
jgi:hypothetical protein